MKRVLVLLGVPLICVIALVIDGFGSSEQADSVIAGSPPPEPLPVFPSMVYVPAGDFLMGTAVESLYRLGEVDEFPQRKIWLDDYYIDIHEVTNAQYKVYLDSTKAEPPHRWEDGNYGIGEDGWPIISIRHDEAVAYARFIGKRLPTEAEWEKAARGVEGRRFPWGDNFDPSLCNNGDALMPIMSFPGGVSPYGLYDMAGNAAEWVDGWYEAYPRTEEDILPRDLPDRKDQFRKNRRIYRGGSWNSFMKFNRCANRENTKVSKSWVYVGFRCAMDPPWKKR